MAKDDDKGKKGGIGGLKEYVSSLFEKEEPGWDDGTDRDTSDDPEKMGGNFVCMVMSAYGGVAGFFGCQYVKYLHQRFACNAWGIELTSRHVKSYGVPQIAEDIIATFVVYALLSVLGWLISIVLKNVYLKDMSEDDEREMSNRAIMYGFLFMVVMSVVMLIMPFNVFLIGVP